MAANPDFRELFSALYDADADYLVVGAHAVMVHTEPRYTKDLDLWIRPTAENARRVHAALVAFGAPMGDLAVADLAVGGTIFQIGIEPNRIDVVTSIDGVLFEDAWPGRVISTYDGVPVQFLGIPEIIINKRTIARPQERTHCPMAPIDRQLA